MTLYSIGDGEYKLLRELLKMIFRHKGAGTYVCMSGERDEFNFVSIIPTWLLERIPSVFPECVNENIEESVFSNWQLLSS